MCRLYGFRSNEPTKVECTLVHAQNALMIQSRSDLSGTSHTDGWGIGYFSDTAPRVERRERAAYQDTHFSSIAERVYARTVVAHVRRATVGGTSRVNTHPFSLGHWIFAHNGTVQGIDRFQSRLEEETRPRFRDRRQGETDSEQAFLWLMSLLAEAGQDPDRHGEDLGLLVEVLGRAVVRLARWCAEAEPNEAAKLNFLLTDGRVLVASRWNHSLHWVLREGVHDCEICGIPHVHHGNLPYRAVVIASEPISREAWAEVPDRHVISVNERIEVGLEPM